MFVLRMFTCVLLYYSTCYAQRVVQCADDKHRASATLCTCERSTKEPGVQGQHESNDGCNEIVSRRTHDLPGDMLNPSILHFIGIALATYFIVKPICS